MIRDYKKTSSKSNSGKSAEPFLLGLFIGLLLGLGIALGVAWYINKMPSPFVNKDKTTSLPSGAETKLEPPSAPQPKPEEKLVKTPNAKDKPRFDFYKILPGAEEPVTDQELRQAAKQKEPSKDTYFIQAGAFQNITDADNLKAKLALMGVEAGIQSATLADKSVWHRVRAGPYNKIDEINRVRTSLKQNGIDTSLIKVHDAQAR